MKQHSIYLVAPLLIASLAASEACSHTAEDCAKIGCTAGSGGSTASSGTEGGSGNGGGPPAGCDPTLSKNPVASTCGIFVSSSKGKDSNGGSQSAPLKTISRALEIAKGKPIYACGESFKEAVTLPAGAILFGALDCKHGWSYEASKPTELTAETDETPMTLSSGSGTTQISDFSITAVDAKKNGGSSIAVLANGVEAELERCTLTAGKGADGKAGEHQDQVETPASADGKQGKAGCTSMSTVVGGDPGSNTCGGDMPAGGIGGSGGVVTGQAGGDGSPINRGTAPQDGKGQHGDQGSGCLPGDPGDPGTNGDSGAGAKGLGSLTSSGYAPPAAKPGASNSTFGQGGGGGGGAAHGSGACTTDAGPSGGGGGAGGCGGAAGKAGGSGGSSIGLVSINATVTLKGGSITTSNGGSGGAGGDGQEGGNGGQNSVGGGSGACGGGSGGKGGRGGSGGGGAGGYAIGVAFHGGKPPTLTQNPIQAGQAGSGAIGGDADMSASAKGDDGKACSSLDFAKEKCAP